jgi:hypothetical protein
MTIPDIVKEHVLKNCGRMPETQQEVDEYLDLINHAKKYEESLILTQKLGKRAMKKWGLKKPDQVKEEGKKLFPSIK